jgi:hypothetical protein
MLLVMEQLEKKEKSAREAKEETQLALDIAEKDLADLHLEKSKFDTGETLLQESQIRFEKKLKDDVEVKTFGTIGEWEVRFNSSKFYCLLTTRVS